MRLPPHAVRQRVVTRASLDETWKVLSDTDRFNRVLGTGAVVARERQPDGTILTIGEMQRAGMTLRWVESPREFVAPHWMHSVRQFQSGPLDRMELNLALEATSEGTEVLYTAVLHPRNALFWPIVYFSARQLDQDVQRTLERAAAHLDGRDDFEPMVTPLTDEAEAILTKRLAQVPEPVRTHLGRHIRDTPSYRQGRMSPLLLARMWDIDEDEAVRGFLLAAREGVLKLGWELLCPNCRQGDLVETLPGGPITVHCPSCNIRYDGGFLDACAITFTPVPEIRDALVPAACLMGPTRTPHVLARDLVPPGANAVFQLALPVGAYRIESDDLKGACTVEVTEDAPEGEVAVDLTDQGVFPPRVRVRPGSRRLTVRSRLRHPDYVHVQSRNWDASILTAERFLARHEARELLPKSAVTPKIHVESRRGAVLAIEKLRGVDEADLESTLRSYTPDRLQIGPQRVTALWGDPERALRATQALTRFVSLSAGLSVGTVLEVGDDAIGGPAAAQATDASRAAGAGRFLLTESVLESPECRPALETVAHEAYGPYHALPLSPARIANAPIAPNVDERFGDYTLGAPMGEGGFGRVYAATHAETGEAAAVKVLRTELAEDPEYVERFYEECRLTARVEHPGIVKVLDWGFNANGRLYLAMQRLYGPLFSDEIEDRNGVTPLRAAAVAAAVLDALDQAHGLGVVHCDVKSNNVLIDHHRETSCEPYLGPGERVVLLDFGASSPIRHRFQSANTLGTLAFMPPEQRKVGKLDARADLYSVGMVILHGVFASVPEKPQEAAGRLPLWLAPIVRRAVDPDRDKRWPSAWAMREALMRGLDQAHEELEDAS